MKFSLIERRDLLFSWFAIALAFTILMTPSLGIDTIFFTFFLAAITVGVAFLLHEIAHKFMAYSYRCWAEFRADKRMLIFMIVTSFFGFIFAAPGATLIKGHVNDEKNGKIALAGPTTNLVLGTFLLLLTFFGFQHLIITYGYRINTWLALFNLIPFFIFDGAKILRWNKLVYFVTLGYAFLLFFAETLI